MEQQSRWIGSRAESAEQQSPGQGREAAAALGTDVTKRALKGRHRKVLSAAWPALLLASVMLLPWLGKAHTTDDTTFLLMAQQVLKDPLHPTAFEMVADGNRIRLSSQLVSGPVMAYLLVPSVLLGGAEWAAHLVQYLLMLAAILATVSLSFRLGLEARAARIAGLLLASTPAVMVMATTSMADVPAMAFAVLGMERYFAWREQRRWYQCVFAALFFALAALSRPHLILILPVILAFECASLLPFFRRPSRTEGPSVNRPGHQAGINVSKEMSTEGAASDNSFNSHVGRLSRAAMCAKRALLLLFPLVLAGLLTIAITILTADPIRPSSDFLHATISRFHPTNTASNLAAFLVHWSLVFPLSLLWLSLGVRWRQLWRKPALWLGCGTVLLTWMLDRESQKVPTTVLALSFIGAFVLLDILWDSLRKRDSVQFFLGTWLLIALPAIAYVQLPCKYLVASAPAMAILLAMLVQRSNPRLRFTRWVAVSAGVILSLLIIAADAEFAAIGRRVAADQIKPRVANGIRVWANGEWGFEWYALKAGAIPVSNQHPYPSAGDVLVSSSAAPHIPLELFPNRHLLATISEKSRFGRIMDYSAGTGFYSNGFGYFPWVFSKTESETVSVWTIP
jgi:hypothetical protein